MCKGCRTEREVGFFKAAGEKQYCRKCKEPLFGSRFVIVRALMRIMPATLSMLMLVLSVDVLSGLYESPYRLVLVVALYVALLLLFYGFIYLCVRIAVSRR